MKNEMLELLRNTNRLGIENLIKNMEDNGFFTAPCSSQFHLCRVGGLLEHSLNVCRIGFNLSDFMDGIDINSWIIASTLHDLGKMGQFGKPLYTENYLASGKISDKKPFETNKNLLAIPHEIRSIQIASQFIELTEEENFAILHHNGMYGDLKYQLTGKETPLQILLHFCDMWASRVMEVEK